MSAFSENKQKNPEERILLNKTELNPTSDQSKASRLGPQDRFWS